MTKLSTPKKILIICFLVSIVIGTIFFITTQNSSIIFEDTFAKISSWQIYDYESDYHNKSVSKMSIASYGYNDASSLYMESKDLNDIRLYRKIDVDPNSYYKISAMVKASCESDDGIGASISAIKCYEYVNIKETNGNWEKLEAYVKTKSNQTSMDVSIGLGGYSNVSKGYAYFDDFKIEKLDSLPIGKKAISLVPKDYEEEFVPNICGKYIFAILMLGIFLFSIFVCFKGKSLKKNERIKLEKRDYIIMAVLTLLCGFISFYKLGNNFGAENFWKPGSAGEYVIVDFGKVTKVTRIAHYGNIRKSGYYQFHYTTKDDNYNKAFTLGENIEKETKTKKIKAKSFVWEFDDISLKANKIKIECKKPGWAINELAFFTTNDNGEYEIIPIEKIYGYSTKASVGIPEMLFDEQELVPSNYSYMNSAYFDEKLFATTAYEHLNGLDITEWTHPPLGKIIISLGITIFGMNPFGYRVMGTIFGILLVPLMYLFAFKIFKKSKYAFLAAFLMMFDFMRFTHTRVSTVDSYLTFFIICMYYFMYDYLVKNDNKISLRTSLKPLLLSGIMFGLGAATKWSAIYAGGGLAFLFFLSNLIKFIRLNKKSKKAARVWIKKIFIPTCLWCVLFFIVIPLTIYILSYIPYLASHPGQNVFEVFVENTKEIFEFHSELQSTHTYASKWYTWVLDMRPFLLYVNKGLPDGMYARILSFGNPAVWWISTIFVFVSLFFTWRDKDKNGIILLVAYAFQYITWALISRTTYIYAYFTAIPFAILLFIYCIKKMDSGKKSTNVIVGIYLLIVLILFVMFFPTLTGMPFNKSYLDWLKWLPTW